TPRGVVRDALKKHKRLPPSSQSANLPTVTSTITSYLPYLLALDYGLRPDSTAIRVEATSSVPTIEWRPTLTDVAIPGREGPRAKIRSLDQEVSFVLLTLANAHTLLARAALHPLYLTSIASVGTTERTTAIQAATRSLLDAASIYEYAATRAENRVAKKPIPCVDIAPSTIRGLGALALAEATLLAVLKDDPYPAVVAQDRNENDREWMYKAPDIPKVRAHLFARLCLAAAEHAARASAQLQAAAASTMAGKVDGELVKYVEDLRRTSRAKACRFFGIDAELGGQSGTAIAWLNAGLQELGAERKDDKKSFGLSRLKREWSDKREDKRVERETDWGADGGKLEETRVLDMLSEKWNKMNDTVLTQAIPPTGPLLAKMPTGREIHSVQPFQAPTLDKHTLDSMRALPEQTDEFGGDLPSSDDESAQTLVSGAYPESTGTPGRSGSASIGYY
ncbi:hypothetical protein jhhlp_006503, partial [Lomentospora prolificans]